jgi:hypothetical protein
MENTTISQESIALKHYQDSEAELKALPESEVKQINLDTQSTIATVLGVLVKMRAFREQIAQLPGHDMTQFDALERYVGTMSQADAYHTIATSPPDDLTEVQAEGVALREVFYTDAQVQVRRGLISADALKDLKGAVGYKNVAADLQSLSTVYFSNWDKLSSTTSVKQAEIERAQQLSFHLFRGIGQREQSPALVEQTADMRARAFTLLTNAYDNARRAIIYLRWHEGDADLIAPSLFAGRSNGRSKPNEQHPAPAPAAGTPTVAMPTSGANTNATHLNNPDVSAKGPFVQ